MNYLGNKEILNNYKIGFLCSRKVPANIILKTYDWTVEQREKGVCVVSGFHSKIEKDVFDILIKGTQPIILVLARSMMNRWPQTINDAVKQERLLIISPFEKDVKRITSSTALKRNEQIVELADEIIIPYQVKDGLIDNLIHTKLGSKKILSLQP
jgi:predicted Rossmann fold nucleotide-binding protein DprA/Smf involved in DNA uptake